MGLAMAMERVFCYFFCSLFSWTILAWTLDPIPLSPYFVFICSFLSSLLFSPVLIHTYFGALLLVLSFSCPHCHILFIILDFFSLHVLYIISLDMYFQQHCLVDNHKKVIYFSSYLANGALASWYRTLKLWLLNDFDAFIDAFKQQFQDSD